MQFFGRTDLASEAHSMWQQREGAPFSLPGLDLRQEIMEGLEVTAVEISGEEASLALGKPLGKYFTLQLPAHFERGSEQFPRTVSVLQQLIRRCLPQRRQKVFLAALGNPDITPDALGSLAASHLLVTRHLKQSMPEDFSAFRETSLCRTGVLGTTGMESALQIRCLCRKLQPDCLIAVDALAGAELSRLCSTIQVSSSGIAPGSGVGNDREALNQESLGLPVVAIGMPTVVDAGLFSDAAEAQRLFVTPRDIDSVVRHGAKLIGYGINLAVHEGLSLEDLDLLIG